MPAPRKDSTNLILSVVCAVLCVVGAGLALSFGPELYAQLTQPTFQAAPSGIVKNPPKQVRDFTLLNQEGKPMSLSELRGKPVLMFFGYTHCPDVCPVALADFVQIKKQLGEKNAQVAFVSISVDGERDTPAVMKNYVHSFDLSFIGLTDDPEKVRGIIADYGANFMRQQTGKETAASYLVAHTAFTYLLDAQGRWRVAYPFGTPAKEITADVEKLLAEK